MTIGETHITIEGHLVRIAHLEGDRYQCVDSPDLVLDALRKSDTRIDLFTFTQMLSETSPKHSYPMEWDNVAALKVSTFDYWWTKQVDAKTRNMVRKAEKKGVTLREVAFDDALVEGIWRIYNECPVRQGRPFLHFGSDIGTVRRISETFLDYSVFIGAFLGDSLIGFVKLVVDQDRTQAGLMHIISMIQHRDKAPTNALIAHAVRSCSERRIPYLVYSSFSYGKKDRDSVTDFKENNGFRRIDLPRYYIPLTSLGRVALQLGLHHRFVDRFPKGMTSALRSIRNAWYKRKAQAFIEVS